MEAFVVDAALGKNLKFRDLAKRLAGPANAYSALFRLWSFAAVYRKDGNLTGIDAAEMMLTTTEWMQLVQARKPGSDHGFVDVAGEVCVIHDWHKSQAYLAGVEKRKAAARTGGFASAAARQEAIDHEWSIARAKAMAEQRGHDRAEVDSAAAIEERGQLFTLKNPFEARAKVSPLVTRDVALEKYLDETFLWFYEIYPKHEGRQMARKAWARLHKDLMVSGAKTGINKVVKTKMVEYIAEKLDSNEWEPTREKRRYIPDPSVFLNQRKWEV